MYLNILLPSVLALYAIYSNKLTIPGVIIAWIFGFIIVSLAGHIAFGALSLSIGLILLSDLIKKAKDDKKRSVYQIISNLLTSVFSVILYYLTNLDLFYTMFYAVLACCLADSLASGIGSLSKSKPINIFTFRKMEKGESGGVSHLGNLAAFTGGVIMGVIYFIHTLDWYGFIVVSLMGLAGSTIDTILGTLFQAQYRCHKCKKVIEEKKHCRVKTKLIKGYAFIDNNLVNLLSNALVFVLSYLVL